MRSMIAIVTIGMDTEEENKMTMNVILASAAITLIIIAVSRIAYISGYNKGFTEGSDDTANIILDRMEEVFELSEEDKEYRRKMQGGK